MSLAASSDRLCNVWVGRWSAVRELVRSYVRTFELPYDDEQDVVQRALIKAWRGWDSFEGRSLRSSWIYRVARNEFLTWRRANPSRTVLTDGLAMAVVPSSEERVLAKVALERRLVLLDEIDRRILSLRYLEDLTSEQVGKRLGMAPSSVRCRVLRLKRAEQRRRSA